MDLIAMRNSDASLALTASKLLQEAAQLRGVAIKNTTITVRDGSNINIRIYSPPQTRQNGNPVYVAFHGGGFIVGGYV